MGTATITIITPTTTTTTTLSEGDTVGVGVMGAEASTLTREVITQGPITTTTLLQPQVWKAALPVTTITTIAIITTCSRLPSITAMGVFTTASVEATITITTPPDHLVLILPPPIQLEAQATAPRRVQQVARVATIIATVTIFILIITNLCSARPVRSPFLQWQCWITI
jgi:hypothetical protein